MRSIVLGVWFSLALWGAGYSQDTSSELYRVLTIRVAPGEFKDMLEAIPGIRAAYEARGDRAPFVLRHTQGDHWDLMLIEPWGSFHGYVTPERMAARQEFEDETSLLQRWLDDAPAFREDLFAMGPSYEVLEPLFADHDFYHVEMFHALPHKKAELVRQREMENLYYQETERAGNQIFTGISGSDVDVFTIGFYPDHATFAAGAPVDEAAQDAAAVKAGFEGVDAIAPYLRSLISRHHDTLAVSVE